LYVILQSKIFLSKLQVVSHTMDPRSSGSSSGGGSGMLQLSLPSVTSQPGQPRIISLPIRTSSSQQLPPQQPEKMEVDAHAHPHVAAPTHYITVSPLSKASPKKAAVGGVKGGGGGLEKKSGNSREREYDPNKHCGVWDGDAKRNCTRSLTCKSHSVYLKRKVINRSGTFDELLAAHKADKELASGGSSGPRPAGGESQVVIGGQTASLAETAASSDSQSSILARRLQLAPGSLAKSWEQSPTVTSNNTILTTQQSSLLKPALIRRPFFQQQQQQLKQQQYHQTQLAVSAKEFYCDENLHFTTGALKAAYFLHIKCEFCITIYTG
jgi:SCA7, zinc-binding domain